ncbi:MAG TPA: tRNA pseudouridine(38-40) synthase TruA [candidate division Zixibacteria bacterium]|nr:tRNA pseudouridine(38-40) synthase TruA [candidate division Zixibacteria bacterium]
MPNFKLTISYDGTDFCGWQVQPKDRTVQGEIEACLGRLYDREISITGAGRTDAGVHAIGQVASVTLPDKFDNHDLMYRMNSILPDDVAITSLERVADDFSARFSAVGKIYEYSIVRRKTPRLRNFALLAEHEFDMSRLHETAEAIIGVHDFSAFAVKKSLPENPTCNIFSARWREGDILRFTVEGNRFLHQMIRGLVGAMLDCSRGKFSAFQFAELLQSGERSVPFAVSPPHGLCLIEVKY